MDVKRTPDRHFRGLKDYAFEPHYVLIPDGEGGTLRMHYVDEGPEAAPVLLLLHGQGQWAYMYRHMIPLFVAAGFRVIAPDYIGFGRSDKLVRQEDYTFQRHIDWLTSFLRGLELQTISAYMFDWGAFFGLRLAMEQSDVFDRIVISNGRLPTGDEPQSQWFLDWRERMRASDTFPMGELVNKGVRTPLSVEEIAAYEAPYPDESYKTGPRQCPEILPVTPDNVASDINRNAWKRMGSWTKSVLTLFSSGFPGAQGAGLLLDHVPGCAGQPHHTYDDLSFYLTEDAGVDIAARIIAFLHKEL